MTRNFFLDLHEAARRKVARSCLPTFSAVELHSLGSLCSHPTIGLRFLATLPS